MLQEDGAVRRLRLAILLALVNGPLNPKEYHPFKFCGCDYCKTAKDAIDDAADHHKRLGEKDAGGG